MQLKRLIITLRHTPIALYGESVTPPPVQRSALLQENGTPLLLESGGMVLLEGY